MKSYLFLIRLENGNALILQAASEADAVASASLTEEVFEHFPKRYQTPEGRAGLVASGVGPQHFTVMKLDSSQLFLELDLQDNGEFKVGLGEYLSNAVHEAYPDLERALTDERWIEAIPEGEDSPIRRVLNAQVSAAVEVERARLLVK